MKTRQDRDERKILWTVCACWAHRDSGCALSFKGIKVTEVCMVESVGGIRAAGLEKGGKHGCAQLFRYLYTHLEHDACYLGKKL